MKVKAERRSVTLKELLAWKKARGDVPPERKRVGRHCLVSLQGIKIVHCKF